MTLVLQDIHLQILEHEIVAILGPSGCGKSTLLRAIIGLEQPTSGRILYRGKPQTGLNADIGLVFQNFALFPWLTVQENVAVGLTNSAADSAEQAQRVGRVVELVGLAGSEEAYPKELSGGMKQRVGLARALVGAPRILCMDEPFSALDVLTSESLRTEVIHLNTVGSSPATTIVMVTHSIGEAIYMATRLVVMGAHPGSIRAVIDNPLPYPRDEGDPGFVALSQQIHSLIAQTGGVVPVVPVVPVTAPPMAHKAIQSIPPVSLSKAIGLLLVLESGGGADLFDLTRRVRLELTHLLPVVKAAEILGWVTTPGGSVELTPEGTGFLRADVQERKRLLNAVLRGLFVFNIVVQALELSPAGEVDEGTVMGWYTTIFPQERPMRLMRTVVSWARYAALFEYSSPRKVFHGLAGPGASPKSQVG